MAVGGVPEQIAGYPVVRRLGQGGMGVVYLVQHPRVHRLQALKVIAPQFASDPVLRKRFLREAQIAAAVEHPSLVSIYDQDERDGVLHLAMQFVDGPDLARLLREGRPPSPAEVAVGVRQVAAALDTVHAEGLVHRDVKCSNILVSGQDGRGARRWVLTDFGIARALDQNTDLTGAGLVASIPYCAPERFDGDPGTAASDVYALACVTAEVLTGRAPFGTTAMSVIRAHARSERPKHLDVLPGPVADLIRHGLAPDPADRPASAGAFAADLSVELERCGSAGGAATSITPVSSRPVFDEAAPLAEPARDAPTADALTHLAETAVAAPPPVAQPEHPAAPAAGSPPVHRSARAPATRSTARVLEGDSPREGRRAPRRRLVVLGSMLAVASLAGTAVWTVQRAPSSGAGAGEGSGGTSSETSSPQAQSLAAATAAESTPAPSEPSPSSTAEAAGPATVAAGPAPWSAAPLDPAQVPAVALTAFRSAPADARATCPLLLPADSAGAPPGSVRQPDFSGDWAVTWDVPGTPGTLPNGEDSPTAGRSTYGIAGVPITWDDSGADSGPAWPERLTWDDGSTAGYGPEGLDPASSSTLAYVTVAGHEKCLYNVWTHLGQDHLTALLADLRFVDTDA